MKHVKTLNTRKLQNTIKKGGCGECQTSCQSACKTSCTVGNQTCENCKSALRACLPILSPNCGAITLHGRRFPFLRTKPDTYKRE